MKKLLLLSLFSLQYQITQTSTWQPFNQIIELPNSKPVDTVTIDPYRDGTELIVSPNQNGQTYHYAVLADFYIFLWPDAAPINPDQLAVNRLRKNPLIALEKDLFKATANCTPGTILIEEKNHTDQVVSTTIIQTGFSTDVTSLAFDENCNFLCAGSRDGKLQLWKRTRVEADAQKSSSDLSEKPLNSKEKECPDER